MEKIRLGLVDDNKDFCEALQEYFSRQEDMQIVFTAEDGMEAIDQIKKCDVDVLVLDLIMPASGRHWCVGVVKFYGAGKVSSRYHGFRHRPGFDDSACHSHGYGVLSGEADQYRYPGKEDPPDHGPGARRQSGNSEWRICHEEGPRPTRI